MFPGSEKCVLKFLSAVLSIFLPFSGTSIGRTHFHAIPFLCSICNIADIFPCVKNCISKKHWITALKQAALRRFPDQTYTLPLDELPNPSDIFHLEAFSEHLTRLGKHQKCIGVSLLHCSFHKICLRLCTCAEDHVSVHPGISADRR